MDQQFRSPEQMFVSEVLKASYTGRALPPAADVEEDLNSLLIAWRNKFPTEAIMADTGQSPAANYKAPTMVKNTSGGGFPVSQYAEIDEAGAWKNDKLFGKKTCKKLNKPWNEVTWGDAMGFTSEDQDELGYITWIENKDVGDSSNQYYKANCRMKDRAAYVVYHVDRDGPPF